jgi:predicted membrane protein (TIGR00267 family)
MAKLISRLKEYNSLAQIGEIGRRYFAMNSFDGILTILGVLIGNYLAGVKDAGIIISIGVAASVAMGISGFSGTYFSEEAERKKKLKSLEKATLRKLGNTKIGKAERYANIVVALINGTAPLVTALLVIIPFFLTSFIDIQAAYVSSVAIALLLLLGLGGFLGHVSEESIILSSIKMFAVGVVCIAVLFMLGISN